MRYASDKYLSYQTTVVAVSAIHPATTDGQHVRRLVGQAVAQSVLPSPSYNKVCIPRIFSSPERSRTVSRCAVVMFHIVVTHRSAAESQPAPRVGKTGRIPQDGLIIRQFSFHAQGIEAQSSQGPNRRQMYCGWYSMVVIMAVQCEL